MMQRVTDWLYGRLFARRSAQAIAAEQLAKDLGLPMDAVAGILDRTATDLRKLSSQDADIDARPIINRAVRDLSKLGFHYRPHEEAIMLYYLRDLPERDYQVLRHYKHGKSHRHIAELMGTDVDSVRRSLVKTYADLRIRMIEGSAADHPPGAKPSMPAARQVN